MSYALVQLKEFPLATYNTYNDADSLNTAPLAANLNRAPHFRTRSHKHYGNSKGLHTVYHVAPSQPSLNLG